MTGRCTLPSAASLATAWCNGLQSSCAHLQSSVEKLQASVTQRCVNSIPSKNVCVCVFFLGFPRCPPSHSFTLSFLSMLCNFFFLSCFYLCDFFRSQCNLGNNRLLAAQISFWEFRVFESCAVYDFVLRFFWVFFINFFFNFFLFLRFVSTQDLTVIREKKNCQNLRSVGSFPGKMQIICSRKKL